MFTVGVNLIGNDVSVAILDGDGTIVAVAEEERYSRMKGGRCWASPAWVLDVLDEHGVPRDAVRRLGMARIQSLHACRPPAPSTSSPGFAYWEQAKAMSTAWLVERLSSCEFVGEVRHHLCHAASAFYPSPFEEAAILTADGVGEVETATIWRADRTSGLEPLWSIALPHSLGFVYEAVAGWVGLTGVEREGKLMGLAAFGEPRFAGVVRKRLLRADPERVFVVGEEFVRLPQSSAKWTEHLVSLFGPRGAGGDDLRTVDADVAASVQLVLEECISQLAHTAKKLTGADRCVAAGGVFMNSVANGHLRRSGPFIDLWVQPLSSDAGTSLGAALVAQGGSLRAARMRHAFLGSALGDVDLAAQRAGLARDPADDVYERVADLLLDGKIVGWACGRAEVGARALGHRSILADPRKREIRDTLNGHTKERERWRPFAPILLEEDAHELIDPALPVPFMNMVLDARAPDRMAAAVHVDGSARVQTVPRDEPELEQLRRLLEVVRARTGNGVLLNTSLNGRGEPIARTADDVVDMHRSCRLDAVVLDGALYVGGGHDAGPRDAGAGAATPLDTRHWLVVGPWWQPSDVLLAQAGGSAWTVTSGSDVASIRHGVAELIRDDPDAAVLIAVPIWAELAGRALGCMVGELVPPETSAPVLLLDESGRLEQFVRTSTSNAETGAIERWWRSRLASASVLG